MAQNIDLSGILGAFSQLGAVNARNTAIRQAEEDRRRARRDALIGVAAGAAIGGGLAAAPGGMSALTGAGLGAQGGAALASRDPANIAMAGLNIAGAGQAEQQRQETQAANSALNQMLLSGQSGPGATPLVGQGQGVFAPTSQGQMSAQGASMGIPPQSMGAIDPRMLAAVMAANRPAAPQFQTVAPGSTFGSVDPSTGQFTPQNTAPGRPAPPRTRDFKRTTGGKAEQVFQEWDGKQWAELGAVAIPESAGRAPSRNDVVVPLLRKYLTDPKSLSEAERNVLVFDAMHNPMWQQFSQSGVGIPGMTTAPPNPNAPISTMPAQEKESWLQWLGGLFGGGSRSAQAAPPPASGPTAPPAATQPQALPEGVTRATVLEEARQVVAENPEARDEVLRRLRQYGIDAGEL
jgi:hypothetical protein